MMAASTGATVNIESVNSADIEPSNTDSDKTPSASGSKKSQNPESPEDLPATTEKTSRQIKRRNSIGDLRETASESKKKSHV